MLGELHEHVNYVGKGVDKNEPLLPICMPRGYGGVAVLWNINIDHMIKPLDVGSERIQGIEITGKSKSNLVVISVYLPAKGGKNHTIEYQDTIDQLYELYQTYKYTHKIIIGGDINEDLNELTGTKRNQYLRDFLDECSLSYDNKAKTFVNSVGQESSEIDYFLHNLSERDNSRKQVLDSLSENTSDHYPIRMIIRFAHDTKKVKNKHGNNKLVKRINWDKVDKEWYSAHISANINSLQLNQNVGTSALDQTILETCDLMKQTAILTASTKSIFNAKPKLKVWTPEIKSALNISRQKYKVWKNHGKPSDKNNTLMLEKKMSKKEFRKTIRIELAIQRTKEKEKILETKTKDMKLFHK